MEWYIKLIPPIVSVIVVIAREVINFIQKKLDIKMRMTAEDIAFLVEALYHNFPSGEKLDAFKKLCEQKRLNVDKAVEYLENNIIPISKNINSYQVKTKKSDDDRGVTN